MCHIRVLGSSYHLLSPLTDVCCKRLGIRTLYIFAKDCILQVLHHEELYVSTILLYLFGRRQMTLVLKPCVISLETGLVRSVIEPELEPDSNFELSSHGMRYAIHESVRLDDEIWQISERQLSSE